MRYLLLSSIVGMLCACSNAYRAMQPAQGDGICVIQFKPEFSTQLYKAQVQVVGHDLSGLLLFKTMDDSSTRVVFSTETGIKFFDFGFGGPQEFKSYYVMKKLDKKVVLQSLRNDFELLLMRWVKQENAVELRLADTIYHGFRNGSKIAYYLSDTLCSGLYRAELASKRKKLVTIQRFDGDNRIPDSIYIQHFNFNFRITLKKLER